MQINGKYLAVESAGTGPCVELLHGIGGTSNVFQIQNDAFSSTHQVIRPDFAGAGRSPVADGISIDSHAEDVAAVLDTVGAAEVQAIDDIGHWVPLEGARRTNELLSAFISRIAQSG
jgi:3-oxoadipate enol-lactonase